MDDTTWWTHLVILRDSVQKTYEDTRCRQHALQDSLDVWLAPWDRHWIGSLTSTSTHWTLMIGWVSRPHSYAPWHTPLAPFCTTRWIWSGSATHLVLYGRPAATMTWDTVQWHFSPATEDVLLHVGPDPPRSP
jgi:hypothetical protein